MQAPRFSPNPSATPRVSRLQAPSSRLQASSPSVSISVHQWLKSPLSAFPRFSLSAFALLAFCLSASATVVSLTGGFGYPTAKNPDGTPIEDGHKVSIGTFPDGFDPATADLPALLANWKQFHVTTTATTQNGESGTFSTVHSSSTGTNAEGFFFPGKKIYLLLTRTDAAFSEPASDGSNVRDYALFTSTSPAWTFPSPASETIRPPADRTDLNTSQITTALVGTLNPDGTFALATYSSPQDPGDGSTPSAFDQWLAATFGENSNITAESAVGPSGLTALATFALNSSPDASAPPYTTITDENGRIGIEFTRKKSKVSGLKTYAQACLDLSDWSLPVIEKPVSSTDTTETVRVFPVEPTDKAFFRIRVEPSTPN